MGAIPEAALRRTEAHDAIPYKLRRRNQKLSEEVARAIIRDIVRENIPAGTLLDVEAVMLTHYGVGRPTLREALRILEVQGILSLKPGVGGGPIVEAPLAEDFAGMASLHFQARRVTLRDLVDLRLMLEPLVAEQAAMRSHGSDPALTAILERERSALAGSKVERETGSRMPEEFHPRVAAMSGNPALSLISDSANILCVRLVSYAPDRLARVHAQHRDIGEAILAGNGRLARDRMRRHMEEFTEYAVDEFAELMDRHIEWE
jgi:DNA-binding FadR family transcriptional regulator